MAYTPATLDCIIPRIGAGPAVWLYSSQADAKSTIETDAYFSDGPERGLTIADIMLVLSDLDGNGTITCTVNYVESTTGILAATLA